MSLAAEQPGLGAPQPRPASAGALGYRSDPPRRLTHRPWFVHALAGAVLIGIWQLLVSTSGRVPGLDEVVSFMWTEIRGESHGGVNTGDFIDPLRVSLARYGVGLAVGLPIGLLLGLLLGVSARLRAVLRDSVLVLLVLPSVVWAFAASLWFGFGSTAPITAIVLTAVPFAALNLSSGIAAIDADLAEMSRSFRVPPRRRLMHLSLGGALPSAVTGVRLAVLTSWNSLLIVEWFGAAAGVGWRARFWYESLRYEGFVAWMLLYVVFIILIDWLVLRRLERRVTRWYQPPTLIFAEDDDA